MTDEPDDIHTRITLSDIETAFLGSNHEVAKLMELRLKAFEMGKEIAFAGNKPTHAPYIAADIYYFLLTGKKKEFVPPPPRETKQK